MNAQAIVERIETRWRGKRGAPAIRAKAMALASRLRPNSRPRETAEEYLANEVRRRALGLARMAGIHFDEHGSTRGDHLWTAGFDYVPPELAKGAPYLDMGGAGLGVVVVYRKRVYARSCSWRPSETGTAYLVGRNESGTFFAHAVPRSCLKVRQALEWIWGGHTPIARQGDIALIRGSGPKLPSLPGGHNVDGKFIIHHQHPPLRLPDKGERVIVGRRAAVRVSEETRD